MKKTVITLFIILFILVTMIISDLSKRNKPNAKSDRIRYKPVTVEELAARDIPPKKVFKKNGALFMIVE